MIGLDDNDFDLPRPLIFCPVCKSEHAISAFRRMSDWPLVYVDFCTSCETKHGTLALYEDENLAAAVHPRAKAMASDDPISKRREARAVDNNDERKREMGRREMMRRRLLYYACQMRGPTYTVGWVHQDITRRLEKFMHDVEAGLSPRLMLFMPPRLGKSTLSSKEFVSWVLGHHPDWEIISGSYAVSLPIGFSREIRDRMKSLEYKAVFPAAAIRPDAGNVEAWRLLSGGGYLATGVGGGITGFGAHILDLDDVVKDAEAASSETIRNNTYDWYQTTARTRLSPGGGVLITMTRWHDADLAGRLLEDEKNARESGLPLDEYEQWEVVSYPALADYDEYLMPSGDIEQAPQELEGARLLRSAGEALHPERYNTKALIRLKNSMPLSSWNSLYQQNPVPDSGEYFTSEMFRTYTFLPGNEADFVYFMAWDLAIGEKQKNDWTVGAVCAKHANGNIYVLDMVRGRWGDVNKIVSLFVGMGVKWPLMSLGGIEDGQIKKTMQALLGPAMAKEKVLFSLDETLKPVTDKLLRARPLQNLMQMGQVLFPVSQPWVAKAQSEMLRFPSGTHDDIVDAMAWAIRMSLNLTAPEPKAFKNKATKSWRSKLPAPASTKTGSNYMTA